MGITQLPPQHDLAKRLSSLEQQVQSLATRDVLRNASIGADGLTVNGGSIHITSGGSLIVDGGGTISVPSGALTTAGTISAGALSVTGTGSFGGQVTAGSILTGGNVQGGGLVSTGGLQVNGSGTIAGLITSPGTKSHTVTTGYSAVYIDSGGVLGGNTSTLRHKTHITPAALNLGGILNLGRTVRRFQRKTALEQYGSWDAAPWQVGLIAEEVAKVAPWAVWHNEDGQVEGVRYEDLVNGILALVAELAEHVGYRPAPFAPPADDPWRP